MADAFAFRFEGLAEAAARRRALADSSTLVQQLAKALYARATAILAVSQRLVPVDTGALRSSGHVKVPTVTVEGASVEIVYGGPAAPYAYIVHEDLHAEHAVGQAKYLETAVEAERDDTLKALAEDTRAIIAGRREARAEAA